MVLCLLLNAAISFLVQGTLYLLRITLLVLGKGNLGWKKLSIRSGFQIYLKAKRIKFWEEPYKGFSKYGRADVVECCFGEIRRKRIH